VQICSSCSTSSPDNASHCVRCNADLSELSTTSVARKFFQENPRVKYVRLVVAHDCCPACREAEGAYDKEKVPTLPVEGCCGMNGCRCFYQPFLEELYP
jgi:hypothetical protein